MKLTKLEEEKLSREIAAHLEGGWQLPVFWTTQKEVKALIQTKQDEDEQNAIRYLAKLECLGSVSCQLYEAWRLDRTKIRKIMNKLSYDRMLQVTFSTLIGATRLEILNGSGLIDVACPKCGKKTPGNTASNVTA